MTYLMHIRRKIVAKTSGRTNKCVLIIKITYT